MKSTNSALANVYRPARFEDVLGQSFWIDKLAKRIANNKVPPVIIIGGPSGTGKCLAKDTPILMFDGTVKPVQNVRIGDKLMGPDSMPRTVLSLARGQETMYKITPVKGEPYTVNESHILSLKVSLPIQGKKYGDVINISVRDYLRQSNWFKLATKGYRVGVDFCASPVDVDPYFLGLWLGDGHSNRIAITTADSEIEMYLKQYASSVGAELLCWSQLNNKSSIYSFSFGPSEGGDGSGSVSRSPLFNAIKALGLLNNKHIPLSYKANSRDLRLSLLAGLIDSDGYLSGYNTYEIVQKNEVLAKDIAFVARSLGYAAYVKPVIKTCTNSSTGATGQYFKVSISGDTHEIPVLLTRKKAKPRRQIKSVLMTGIALTCVGSDDYYGFEIDGDRLFLLGDFTVTHNTTTARLIAKACVCLNRQDGQYNPCNNCEGCLSVDVGGGDTNYTFLDGGGDKLSDTIRNDLTPTMMCRPSLARFRCCLIDEFQAFGHVAKSALLTLFEELPETSKIICTTMDIESIHESLRDRAYEINFSPILPEDQVSGAIRAKPELADHQDAILTLAKYSGGTQRRLWSMIDRLDGDFSDEAVQLVTGVGRPSERAKLLKASLERDFDTVSNIWSGWQSRGLNLATIGDLLVDDLCKLSQQDPDNLKLTRAIQLVDRATVIGKPEVIKRSLFMLSEDPVPELLKLYRGIFK